MDGSMPFAHAPLERRDRPSLAADPKEAFTRAGARRGRQATSIPYRNCLRSWTKARPDGTAIVTQDYLYHNDGGGKFRSSMPKRGFAGTTLAWPPLGGFQ